MVIGCYRICLENGQIEARFADRVPWRLPQNNGGISSAVLNLRIDRDQRSS